VDRIRNAHTIKIGVQNTLQTKRDGDPFTLAEVDLHTTLDLDPEPGDGTLDLFSVESEVTPSEWLRVSLDMDYSKDDGAFRTVDARLSYDAKGPFLLSTGYLLRKDRYKLLSANAGVRFGSDWRALVFARYDFEDGRMQEEGITFRRALDCMTFEIELSDIPAYTLDDGTERSNEWSISFTLVFTAFPELGIGGHGGGGGR
jgi:hypothetical protein